MQADGAHVFLRTCGLFFFSIEEEEEDLVVENISFDRLSD